MSGGVSVQGVSDRGVHVLGVSVRGVHVRGGSVLSPVTMSPNRKSILTIAINIVSWVLL